MSNFFGDRDNVNLGYILFAFGLGFLTGSIGFFATGMDRAWWGDTFQGLGVEFIGIAFTVIALIAVFGVRERLASGEQTETAAAVATEAEQQGLSNQHRALLEALREQQAEADFRAQQLNAITRLRQGSTPKQRQMVLDEMTDYGLLHAAKLYRADLRDAHLSAADLRAANLEHTKLTGALLEKADLSAALLQGADLAGADLRAAQLVGADLTGANLQGAKPQGANFAGASLREANLQDAVLDAAVFRGASLEGATLTGAKYSSNTILPDGTAWHPEADVARFTDPAHDKFYAVTVQMPGK